MTNRTKQNTNSNNQDSQDNSDVIDLGKLLGLLLDSKWLIASVTSLFAVIGIAYALLATPIYQADALLQVETKSSGMSSLVSGDLGDMFSGESSATTEVEIIKSRMILGKTVDALNLTVQVSPIYFPMIGKGLARLQGQQVYAAITRFDTPEHVTDISFILQVENEQTGAFSVFNEEGKKLLSGIVGEPLNKNGYSLFVQQLDAPNGTQFSVNKRSTLDAIQWLQQNLSVSERGKQTGILSLSFSGEDKILIGKVLNDISQNYFLQNVKRNSAEAEQSLVFLKQHLPNIKVELTSAEDILNTYRQDNESIDLGMEAQSTLKVMVELESQLNDLTFKESEINQRFTKDHPAYISLLDKREVLLNKKKELNAAITKLPKTQRQVLRMTRDVEVNQQIYIQLLNKVQELSILKAGTVGNVRILDEAQTYSNVNLAQATDSSVVTISGLTNAPDAASLGLTSVESSGADLFSDGTTQGKGALSSGTLTLTVHTGQTVAAGTQYAFSFTITNPSSAQGAASAVIAASGTASFAQAAMVAPGSALLGVANGADPLLVVVPEFVVRKIGQSNPLAGGSNTITVTIQSNVNLAQATDSSVVTISGLTNAPDAASLGLTSVESSGADLFSDGTTQGKGALSSGTLTLTVHTGQTVAAGTQYAFSFTITNPSSAQNDATVTIAASGTAAFPTSRGVMTTDTANVYGVTNGGKPMKVIEQSFSTKAIGQSTPLAGADVTITVTLTANSNFPAGSIVTITGLTGTQTEDTTLTVTSTDGSTSGLLGTSGVWTKSDGKLVLTAAGAGTAYNAPCTVTFVLKQAAAEYTPPTVSVAASIKDGSSTVLGSIAQVAMDAPDAGTGIGAM